MNTESSPGQKRRRAPPSQNYATLKVFTTGQVAKIVKVAPRTVTKWCEQTLLDYYMIPGSAHRRIARDALIRFLKERGLPMELLYGSLPRLMLVGVDVQHAVRGLLERHLQAGVATLVECGSMFELGLKVAGEGPAALVIVRRSEAGIQTALPKLRELDVETIGLVLNDEDEGYANWEGFSQFRLDSHSQDFLEHVNRYVSPN